MSWAIAVTCELIDTDSHDTATIRVRREDTILPASLDSETCGTDLLDLVIATFEQSLAHAGQDMRDQLGQYRALVAKAEQSR